jgi:ATP-dependent helicase/nuclease subunit A
MSEGFIIPPTTQLAQRRASDPGASAWVSANAGSGKTTVLANRVIRLLLEKVEPEKILSITFTKAAAANMAARVFGVLSGWVTLDDAALCAELEKLEGRRPDDARLALARQLFARAIETPGGLKIQTIHAFCERLLHLFPFEANVAARFEVLDEATGAELLSAARRAVLARASAGTDPVLGDALSVLNEAVGEDAFADLVAVAIRARSRLGRRAEGRPAVARLMADLARQLGVPEGARADDLWADVLAGGLPVADWPGVIDALRRDGKARDNGFADSLAAALAAGDPEQRRSFYSEVFLTRDAKPRADTTFVTKDVRTRNPALADRLSEEKARLGRLMDAIRAAAAVERTQALFLLADAVARLYEDAKSRRGALDFDDLIARTSDLLSRKSEAAWVLYKLDQGIDHILVDEAQDTSEPQWAILRAIAEDFVAGHGRSSRVRTLFAVGDPKQSIYSFQGAAPEAFEAARRHFKAKVEALARPYGETAPGEPERWRFENVELTLSFRSAPAVLSAVDTVFAPAGHHRSLSFGDPVAPAHQSAREKAAGLVEIWDLETPEPEREVEAWDKPLDQAGETAPPVRLAERIAATLARWQREGDETGRRVPPGDVLILVRNRNTFFEAVIRALKTAGVPVAGADRLALTQHIAVLDLIALGRASLLPEDDLTLAAVLKSPFVGLGDDELQRAAAGRTGSLASALARLAEREPAWAPVQEKLVRWRSRAAACGPFAFYAGILGAEGGRRAVLGRLGTEAGDAVDEFLRLALDFEQRQGPSLPLFLAALADADLVIKRDMDTNAGEVRVMTVHGAKGLEAPVVILADTCTAPNGRHDDPVLLIEGPGGPLPVWSGAKAADPGVVAAARQAGQDKALQEYHRLLYVAMTRAKDRLVIAGYEGKKGRAPGCWYDMVSGALKERMTEETVDGRTVWRLQTGSPAPAPGPDTPVPPPELPLPGWLRRPAGVEPAAPPPLRPSSAVVAADAALPAPVALALGDPDARARARLLGRCIHTLLEILPGQPPGRRHAAGEALLAARVPGLSGAERQQALAAVDAILDSPGLAPLFGPGSRAEVPIAGDLPLGANGAMVPVTGQIDRLAVTPEATWLADFKTGQPPSGEVSDDHAAQLALYAALLGRLYPGRPVRAVLVFSQGPVVREVPEERLAAALAQIKAA